MIVSSQNIQIREKLDETSKQNCNYRLLWQNGNYLLGGLLFTAGSVVNFPTIHVEESENIAALIFTIASGNFLLKDVTDWKILKNYKKQKSDEQKSSNCIKTNEKLFNLSYLL